MLPRAEGLDWESEATGPPLIGRLNFMISAGHHGMRKRRSRGEHRGDDGGEI